MQMIFKLKELAGVCYNRFISKLRKPSKDILLEHLFRAFKNFWITSVIYSASSVWN